MFTVNGATMPSTTGGTSSALSSAGLSASHVASKEYGINAAKLTFSPHQRLPPKPKFPNSRKSPVPPLCQNRALLTPTKSGTRTALTGTSRAPRGTPSYMAPTLSSLQKIRPRSKSVSTASTKTPRIGYNSKPVYWQNTRSGSVSRISRRQRFPTSRPTSQGSTLKWYSRAAPKQASIGSPMTDEAFESEPESSRASARARRKVIVWQQTTAEPLPRSSRFERFPTIGGTPRRRGVSRTNSSLSLTPSGTFWKTTTQTAPERTSRWDRFTERQRMVSEPGRSRFSRFHIPISQGSTLKWYSRVAAKQASIGSLVTGNAFESEPGPSRASTRVRRKVIVWQQTTADPLTRSSRFERFPTTSGTPRSRDMTRTNSSLSLTPSGTFWKTTTQTAPERTSRWDRFTERQRMVSEPGRSRFSRFRSPTLQGSTMKWYSRAAPKHSLVTGDAFNNEPGSSTASARARRKLIVWQQTTAKPLPRSSRFKRFSTTSGTPKSRGATGTDSSLSLTPSGTFWKSATQRGPEKTSRWDRFPEPGRLHFSRFRSPASYLSTARTTSSQLRTARPCKQLSPMSLLKVRSAQQPYTTLLLGPSSEYQIEDTQATLAADSSDGDRENLFWQQTSSQPPPRTSRTVR
ncbi:unnamed protein product, partial [Gongylonema pulchrum]